MKQYKVRWSSEAEEDLTSIYEYIREVQQEPLNAGKLVQAIIDSTRQLSQFPESHSREAYLSGLAGTYRSIVVKSSYKVLYEVESEKSQVTILRITDTRQSPGKLREKLK